MNTVDYNIKVKADINREKPFEAAVGFHLMNLADGEGLFLTSGRCDYDFSFRGLKGNNITFEVKNDYKSVETDNLFIECAYRGNPSCIAATNAIFWAHYLPKYKMLCIIPTNTLRKFIEAKELTPRYFATTQTEGYLIPAAQITGQLFVKTINFEYHGNN